MSTRRSEGEAKAEHAIVDDLSALVRGRRAHFGGGAIVAGVLLGGMVATMVRVDLLEQPWPVLVAQLSLWLLGLVALPAIGVGVWFPRRSTSAVLAIAAVVLAVLATFWSSEAATPGGAAVVEPRCLTSAGLAGAIGLVLALCTGAFAQCRRRAAKRWLAASVGALSLAAIAWMCSEPCRTHTLVSHVGAALILSLIAVVLATGARDRA